MKPEQKVAAVFAVIGLVMGFFSAFVRSMLVLDFLVPIAVYVAGVFLSKRMVEGKTIKWAVINSLPSFVLVWMVAWILLFNIG